MTRGGIATMNQTVTRADLQRGLSERCGMSVAEAERHLARMLEVIGAALGEGEAVKLTGFGTFEVRTRAPRQGRNPKTGRLYPVGARRVVVFTPSLKLKTGLDALAGGARKD